MMGARYAPPSEGLEVDHNYIQFACVKTSCIDLQIEAKQPILKKSVRIIAELGRTYHWGKCLFCASESLIFGWGL